MPQGGHEVTTATWVGRFMGSRTKASDLEAPFGWVLGDGDSGRKTQRHSSPCQHPIRHLVVWAYTQGCRRFS
jgi:hypothetical protein